MRYAIVIEQAQGNYSAYVPDLPGCIVAGSTVQDVEVHEADAYEVEFVVASGRTQALLTLSGSDVRSLGDQDLLSARSVSGIAV
ncbi:MAG: DUF4926 domain-containing protein [Rhodocyclaceae bacterium]|nr:DUF4926 domain-containing protein [Rhodocyclaceae bacterium]